MFHGGKGNAVKRWRLPELPPCDLLRSLYYDIRDVDYAEFVRAEWIWTRKPKMNSPDLDTIPNELSKTAEEIRLAEDRARTRNWKRWGPYLSERQWATVREDYSPYGNCWDYFPHDHARSRVYRWGEDGLLGFTDRECRLCFGQALWNGRDPILKERLFGLTGPEGNHGEDVKENYYYLDATPTYSYAKALYKYPQGEFPYQRLIDRESANCVNR